MKPHKQKAKRRRKLTRETDRFYSATGRSSPLEYNVRYLPGPNRNLYGVRNKLSEQVKNKKIEKLAKSRGSQTLVRSANHS